MKRRFARRRKKRWQRICDAIQYKYWDVVPYDWRPGQIWYRTKCFFWHRYSTIKCRYLPHTWADRTNVLPHTMFEILSRFIEEECSPGHIDWEGSGHTIEVNGVEKNVRVEMQDLYDWWHNVCMKLYEEVNDILWKEAEKHPPTREFIPINRAGEEIEEEDAEMFRWETEFETPEDDEVHHRCMMAINKLERMRDAKLQEMMVRLVKLTPYLWT